jgi:transposase
MYLIIFNQTVHMVRGEAVSLAVRKQIMRLKDKMGLSLPEIAEKKNLPYNTVRNIVVRGNERISELKRGRPGKVSSRTSRRIANFVMKNR